MNPNNFNVVLWIFACLGASLSETGSGYPYSLLLDQAGRLRLSWRPDYELRVVYFDLTANVTAGEWVGLGFSDYGETTRADVVVYWTGGSGVHHFQDSHTDAQGRLLVDRRQDYELQRAVTSSGHMARLQFQRKFDTCDDEDYQFDRGTTHVIFFISKTLRDPSFPRNVNVTRLSPGLQRIQLLKPDLPDVPLPSDTWTFEVTAPNVQVPATETTYWWYTAKLPPLAHKHHIVKYEPVIQTGSENLVHHMEVFHCEVAANQIVRFYNGPGQSEGKPPELAACRKVIGAWAMGAAPVTLPERAGFPIGGADYSRYVMLEVHYNNPQKRAGRIDNSGIRFHVTSELRQFDAGVMELGLEYTNKMAIPPRQESFALTGYCIQECTQVGLPPEGIRIFASQLHTHLTGRRVYTKHVRGGMELRELNRDNHYSPHFQEIRQLPVPVQILPGDALITTCEDRTADRDNATIGGFAISDEMCVNYVMYYPLVDLEVCKSSIATQALDKFFSFMNKWDLDGTSPSQGDRANYNAIRWTPLSTALLATLYQTSPIAMQCNQSDGNRFPGDWASVRKTTILRPLPPTPRHCDLA